MTTPMQIYTSRCPKCYSEKIVFHHGSDYISFNWGEFSREATCQECATRFTVCGKIIAPLYVMIIK